MSGIDSDDFGLTLDSVLGSVLAHLCRLVADTRFLKAVLSSGRELNFEGSEPCICMCIRVCFVLLRLGSY